MVSGQISPKMKRREFSIFITFSDTYTCTYAINDPIKIIIITIVNRPGINQSSTSPKEFVKQLICYDNITAK